MSVSWVQKYLYLLPATLISFHEIAENDKDDSKLIEELNSMKQQLGRRDIRLIIVIVSDIATDDRINLIRKQTGLASRTGLLFLPASTSTDVEKETLVETLCQMAYAQSIDYYTTISKRIRKKLTGGRSNVMTANSGTHSSSNNSGRESRTESDLSITKDLKFTSPLTNVGWNVRYSFKLSVMAEFRQDIETSLNLYESTYELILELFETLNPKADTPARRWNQARVILDSVAFRIFRIYLYLEQPNIAVCQKFEYHILLVKNIIEAKDFSSSSYAYTGWVCQQYLLLADLVNATRGVSNWKI